MKKEGMAKLKSSEVRKDWEQGRIQNRENIEKGSGCQSVDLVVATISGEL